MGPAIGAVVVIAGNGRLVYESSVIKTIHAVYERGVFRPQERVDLPERCEVEFEPRPVCPSPSRGALDQLYAILSERFESGNREVAARHDEHQP
jgi:predicted DNA-binding antitoxin AbrB/MazE fold protein